MTHIHTPVGESVGNMGLSVLPMDTSTCVLEKQGDLPMGRRLLFHLSYSCPNKRVELISCGKYVAVREDRDYYDAGRRCNKKD